MRKNAFTLAEVLITLGIIGVVAAMTIPTLIANIRSKQYSSKFKKTISTLSNSAKMSNAQYGFDFSGLETGCTGSSANDNPEDKQSICSLLNGTLTGKTYFYGIDKLGKYNFKSEYYNNTASLTRRTAVPIYQLSDGTIIMFSDLIGRGVYGSTGCTKEIGRDLTMSENGVNGNGCYGLIDVNGISLPNKEVKCSVGTNTRHALAAGDCIVNSKDMGDIFPFVIYDSSAIPDTAAGWYVLNSSK